MAFPPFKHDRRAAEPQHDNTGQTLPFRRMAYPCDKNMAF